MRICELVYKYVSRNNTHWVFQRASKVIALLQLLLWWENRLFLEVSLRGVCLWMKYSEDISNSLKMKKGHQVKLLSSKKFLTEEVLEKIRKNWQRTRSIPKTVPNCLDECVWSHPHFAADFFTRQLVPNGRRLLHRRLSKEGRLRFNCARIFRLD